MMLAVVCVVTPPAVARGQSIINAGTQAWVEAAINNRADMLILGDSITNHIGTGWTGGIANALYDKVGLAGGGMMGVASPAVYPGRAGTQTFYDESWFQPTHTLPAELRPYALGDEVLMSGALQPGALTAWMGHDADILDREAGYTWQIWAAGTGASDGTIHAIRSSWTNQPRDESQLSAAVGANVPHNVTRPTLIELSLNPAPGQAADKHRFDLVNTNNTAIFYHRLIDTTATGATVTGWGYSGGTARTFMQDLYDNGRLTRDGRAAYLSNLVYGNSGKLNVVIAEGMNDSGEKLPSLTEGIDPGYSPEAFIDNIKTMIQTVSDDWTHAGMNPDDLSFTLLSTYQLPEGLITEARRQRLPLFRDALRDLAETDPRYSFIDMFGEGPTLQEIEDNGYMGFGVHPTIEGALVFGDVFVEELFGFVPGDVDHDLQVGLDDLDAVLLNWNRPAGPVEPLLGDVDGDGLVGLEDMDILLGEWGEIDPGPPSHDITGDQAVGLDDLDVMLAYWNQAVGPDGRDQGDLDGDGYVGLDDLTTLLAQWNRSAEADRLAADVDGDGAVGLGDMDVVVSHWNEREVLTSPVQVDLNNDGYIGLDDLTDVLLNWGNTGAGATSVPEPGGMGVVMMTAWLLGRRRRAG